MKNKIIPAIAVVALVVAGWVFFFGPLQHASKALFGAAGGMLAENYIPYVQYNGGYNTAKDIITSAALKTTGTLQIGSSGTAQVNQLSTTCSMIADVSITASSTGYAYCTGVTGLTSSDNIQAQIATSTLGFAFRDNIEIITAKASTTAGAVDFEIYNGMGVAAVPSATNRTGSTTSLWISH